VHTNAPRRLHELGHVTVITERIASGGKTEPVMPANCRLQQLLSPALLEEALWVCLAMERTLTAVWSSRPTIQVHNRYSAIAMYRKCHLPECSFACQPCTVLTTMRCEHRPLCKHQAILCMMMVMLMLV
jgi:hypothetical protein